MFNPAAITLRNNRTALVIYAVVMMLGVSTFLSIGRLEYPDFVIRNGLVVTSYPGRTAVQVEEEVTEPLEQALRQMPEMDEIKSTSKPGISIITVTLKDSYFELETIWQDMRNRITETKLPDGAQTPLINDDYGDVYPYIYALEGDGYEASELLDFAEDIRDQLLSLDGVGKVEFHGNQDERVYLEFSSSELSARNVSPADVTKALSAQNAVTSSGSVLAAQERLSLLTRGEFEDLQELADFAIATSDEATALRVSDLFTIRRGYVDPPQALSHFNGERVLCIAISMIQGGVVTEIGARINDKLAEIQSQLPLGLSVEPMFYQPEYVDASVQSFLVNLAQAFFFVVMVMILFAGWRLAMVVGVLVPSATLACFALMPAAGVLLEMMSIAALIIALGLLVDNAVVVSEQILVRLGEGQSREDAVTGATAGLTIPLLAASGTTIAAFSPIALAEGGTSEFTYSLFAVVSLTLLSSWVLSLTIIPLLCYYFVRPLEKETFIGRGMVKLYKPYEALLRGSLKRLWIVPTLTIICTATALWGFQFVPNIFFPPNERGQFVIDLELPLGVDIAETETSVAQLENWLLKDLEDDIRSVSSWIGNGGPRWYLSLAPEPSNPNYAFLSVLTHSGDPADVARIIKQVDDYGRNNFPSARVTAKTLESGPPVGDPIQVRLYGSDMVTLYELRDLIVAETKKVPGTSDVRDDWGAWVKQIAIEPDPVRAPRLGLNTESLAAALSAQFDGLYVTTYREGDRPIPVLVRSREDYRTHPERLPDLPIFDSSVGVVPLGQVATTELELLPGSVQRIDAMRVMIISAKVRGRYASDALADLQPSLQALVDSDRWPAGYHIEYGGETEESAKSQGQIAAAMPISLSMLALILISQFNSLRRFFIICLTVPPMLVGVVPGLLLTGSSFGFMTMLGLIALLGIVVNNAILLIDETDNQLKLGASTVDAIVSAACSRLRPILMTTLTTVIGLLPLAISGGGMWSSMAYAMIFGLSFATALTLLLCPVLFGLFFKDAPAAE